MLSVVKVYNTQIINNTVRLITNIIITSIMNLYKIVYIYRKLQIIKVCAINRKFLFNLIYYLVIITIVWKI